MARARARARVTVTLELDVEGAWGEDCSMGQVYKQARESAVNALRAGVIVEALCISKQARVSATIIGEPKVMAVLVEEV